MTKNVIIHGDSREYLPRITTPINCVIADPPYGMDFQSNNTRLPESKKFSQKIQGDETPEEAMNTFYSIMTAIIPHLATQAEVYVFTAWHVLDLWMPLVKTLPELELKQLLIWSKGYPGLGDLECNWGCGHEMILYLKKGRRPIPKRRSGIIHVDKLASGTNIHPTQKPTALLRQLIEMSTDVGDFVVDPYSGSGSTAVAAMELGRNSLGFETDEQYIEPSRARLRQGGLLDYMS
jgi:adenine-specific DNA-methyltransferase